MKIYVAGYFSDRIMLKQMAIRLQELGHVIVSEWLFKDDSTRLYDHGLDSLADEGIKMPLDTAKKRRRAGAIASLDLIDVNNADTFIIDTSSEDPRGGREVEYGLAALKDKLCIVVGPNRNIFHCLPSTLHVPHWLALLALFGDDANYGLPSAICFTVPDKCQECNQNRAVFVAEIRQVMNSDLRYERYLCTLCLKNLDPTDALVFGD